MNKRRAAAVLREYLRRQERGGRVSSAKARALRDAAFPRQHEFLDDPARMKAALCTRRAGKSFGAGIGLYEAALLRGGVSVLYVALTKESARKIMHKDVLKVLNRTFKLGASFNETTLTVTLPNGSVIYLLGLDASDEEADKVLGQKFARVVIDESASFRRDLRAIIHGAILPTLADLEGDLWLIGTPGNLRNFFYEVTTGKERGWSVHRWTYADNPHVARQMAEQIARLIEANPLVVDTPLFKQHYGGEWTIDTSKLVYRYEDARNAIAELPEARGWRYVMALDLGYEDDTAVVVAAYRPNDKKLYIVYAEKRPNLIISAVAKWLNDVRANFPVHEMIVDGAAKQSVEELRQRHQLPLESAEKQGKVEAIAMMNSDLIAGDVKVLESAGADLVDEWANLIWDERAEAKGKKVENAACANHLSDAALYAWRRATNYAAKPLVKPLSIDTEEGIDAMLAKKRVAARRPWWERVAT